MSARPAVTFDLWHTLVYLEPDGEAAYLAGQYAAAVRALATAPPLPGRSDPTPEQFRAAYDRELRLAVEASHAGRSVTPAEQITRAAHSVGRTPPPAEFERELGDLVRATPFRVAPHALETLERLRDLGFGVGILSNTVGEPGRYLREVLGEHGFDRAVEVYTFSDEQPWTKPAPEIFRATLDRLHGEPGRAMHVGDGWADLAGARNAGLRAGILFTGLHEYAPEYRALNYAPPVSRELVDAEVAELPAVVPIAQRLLTSDGASGAGGV